MPNRRNQRRQLHSEILHGVQQRKEPGPIDAGLTMHVDNSRSRPQKLVEGGLKRWIPIGNGHMRTVNRIQDRILVRKERPPPLRTIVVPGTVDNMTDSVLLDKRDRQHRSGSHENSGMKIRRRISQIHGPEHCLLLFADCKRCATAQRCPF